MHHCHLSLVVKNMEWNIHQAGVLTCPGEKQLTLHRFWVLKNPTAPSTSEMSSAIYLCFLSGSAQFFLFTLLFFVSLLISYLWRAQWWGIFQLSCLQFELEHTWPGESKDCTCTRGRGTACSIGTRMIDSSQTRPLALIGCVDPGAGRFLQITKGWSHRQLTCILHYCQIKMTILANVTKKRQLQTTTLFKKIILVVIIIIMMLIYWMYTHNTHSVPVRQMSLFGLAESWR